MIIAKDLRREVKNWFGSLEPQLFVTHNFGFLVSPETGERSLKRFYNRLQSQVHGQNWNRRDTDQPMVAVGFWEHLDSNPHCHVLVSASDAESAWLFEERKKSCVPFDLAVVRSGSVGPDLPFGHNDDSWSGNDGYIGFDQRIADNWAAIVSARARSGLNVDSNVLLAILDALAIPAIAVLAAFGAPEANHWHCTGPSLVPAGDNNGAGVGIDWQCHRDDDGTTSP
jgi:hypothetical protein